MSQEQVLSKSEVEACFESYLDNKSLTDIFSDIEPLSAQTSMYLAQG